MLTKVVHVAALVSARLPDLRGKSQVGKRARQRMPVDGIWHIRTRAGDTFDLPRVSEMAWTAAFRGGYDLETQRLLTRFVRPGDSVLDIGGALGLWAVPLARAASASGGELHVFEPHPANVRWLEGNLSRNACGASVHPYALGAESGEVVLDAEGRDEGGNAAIVTDREGLTVQVRTLDSFELQGRIGVIKLDVEGYEMEVLNGGRKLIERHRPVVLAEFNRFWLKERATDLHELFDWLRGLGYEIADVVTARSRPWMAGNLTSLRRVSGVDFSGELLLVPPDRLDAAGLSFE